MLTVRAARFFLEHYPFVNRAGKCSKAYIEVLCCHTQGHVAFCANQPSSACGRCTYYFKTSF